MAIVRWDPWRELAALERRFDQAFGRTGAAQRGRLSEWRPAMDVRQEGDTMVVSTELAGVSPDDVEISVDDDVLTITGTRSEEHGDEDGGWVHRERFSGRFQRSISLPRGVDPSGIKAQAKDGVVEIRVPCPTDKKPHRVALNTESSSGEIPVQGAAKVAEAGKPDESAKPAGAAKPARTAKRAAKPKTRG
jgi:HSP20 family protein